MSAFEIVYLVKGFFFFFFFFELYLFNVGQILVYTNGPASISTIYH